MNEITYMHSSRFKTIFIAFTTFLGPFFNAAANENITFSNVMTIDINMQKILNPIEFWSESEKIVLGQPLQDILNRLELQKFTKKSIEQIIQIGDYTLGNKNQCPQKLMATICDQEHQTWLYLREKTGENNYILFFDERAILSKIIEINSQSNALNSSEKINLFLKKSLLAQYINEEPIIFKTLKLNEVPTQCLNAVMAIEDQRFLEHGGVSPTGILRAISKNVLTGKKSQGASTITQQLVKNYFLTHERTYSRKALEILLSIRLESKLTKDEILEAYLNTIYMGQTGPYQVRGYKAAAYHYFDKELTELNLNECATLAAIINGPGIFDPWKKLEKTLQRRNLVLQKMLSLNMISKTENENTLQLNKFNLNNKFQIQETAPYFISAALRQIKTLNIPLEGLKIILSIDPVKQKNIQEIAFKQLSKLNNKDLEVAFISIDNKTGFVNTLIGGRGFKTTQFNRALDAKRQIGSTIKPFIYLTAILNNYPAGEKFTPATILIDEKFKYKFDNKIWSPENYTKKYLGQVPANEALALSLNAATSKIALDLGLDNFAKVLNKFNFKIPNTINPSISLGALELTPFQLAQAYLVFSNFGVKKEISFIKKVYDQNNKLIWSHQTYENQLFDQETITRLNEFLKFNTQMGSAKNIAISQISHNPAGKTGTTNDSKDSWFVGFTDIETAVVWIGDDKNSNTGLTGGSGALPIWIEYFR